MFVLMGSFIEKFILAARNDDVDSWINILFVVILALFWVIGSIIKGKARKTKEMEDKSIGGEPRRPGGYPKGLRKELKESLGKLRQISKAEPPRRRPYYQQQKQARREIPRTQPYIHKGPASIRSAKDKPPEPLPQIKELRPELKELSELVTPAIEQIETQFSDTFSMPQIEYLTEPMLDITDPDEIKKAILHYEILGKPLSLRDPLERIV